MSHESFGVHLTLRHGFEFAADFELPGVADLVLDEPPPLGAGRGPNAARVLATAVGNCLGASLLLCLRKARIEVQALRVSVRGSFARNERGRLRIEGFQVKLEPVIPGEQRERAGRCLNLFEDFCIVTASVRQGIDVQVDVGPVAPSPAVTSA
jgi:organic hydroperoxide reductase OsmC/OhrA